MKSKSVYMSGVQFSFLLEMIFCINAMWAIFLDKSCLAVLFGAFTIAAYIALITSYSEEKKE